jgi:hypothetical protein
VLEAADDASGIAGFVGGRSGVFRSSVHNLNSIPAAPGGHGWELHPGGLDLSNTCRQRLRQFIYLDCVVIRTLPRLVIRNIRPATGN